VPVLSIKHSPHCAARSLALKPTPRPMCRGHTAQPCTAHNHRCPTMHRPSARHSRCSIGNLPSSILILKWSSCICHTIACDRDRHIPDSLHARSCTHQMPSMHCHCIDRHIPKPAPHQRPIDEVPAPHCHNRASISWPERRLHCKHDLGCVVSIPHSIAARAVWLCMQHHFHNRCHHMACMPRSDAGCECR